MWFYSYHSLSTHFSSQFYLTFWQALSTIFAHLLCCAFVKCQVCKKKQKKTINTLHIYFKYRKLWYFDFLQAGKKGQRKNILHEYFMFQYLKMNYVRAACVCQSQEKERQKIQVPASDPLTDCLVTTAASPLIRGKLSCLCCVINIRSFPKPYSSNYVLQMWNVSIWLVITSSSCVFLYYS